MRPALLAGCRHTPAAAVRVDHLIEDSIYETLCCARECRVDRPAGSVGLLQGAGEDLRVCGIEGGTVGGVCLCAGGFRGLLCGACLGASGKGCAGETKEAASKTRDGVDDQVCIHNC
ncbi:hypothetical protein [Streptomyces sp. NPDC007205]|uniref:hypothetical protein n=1 Tax=Streptomyces sp. NPDC007205 TaxID=3154316 RepID=UPI0033D4ACB9